MQCSGWPSQQRLTFEFMACVLKMAMVKNNTQYGTLLMVLQDTRYIRTRTETRMHFYSKHELTKSINFVV